MNYIGETMIRILHVVSKLSINSGVMNVIMNYYRYIDRTKIQFDFLYFEERIPDLKKEIERLGGKVYFVHKPSLKRCINTYKEFNSFFERNAAKYTAVHLHEVYLVHFINHFCKKYNIKHLITHAHTTKYSDNPKNALRNKIMCLGLNDVATDLFACSKAAGKFYYGKEAVDSGKVKIIPNAINLEKYKFNENVRNKIRKELKLEDKFVVGHIGRMAPQKNQKFLLKIFSEVKKRKNNAILLMIGDGPLKSEIEKEIDNLNLRDSVILFGVRNDVPQLLMAMDVFVLPSLFEGLGIVAIEAQASGLTCILSKEVPKEVEIHSCKFLSLNELNSIWADYISNTKRNYLDHENNLQEVFDIRKSVIFLEKLYSDLLRKKR